MTWFERVKACETPEDLAELLDGGERMFCPRKDNLCSCDNCSACIAEWLKEDAGCRSDRGGGKTS